jgi:hypothetical protein
MVRAVRLRIADRERLRGEALPVDQRREAGVDPRHAVALTISEPAAFEIADNVRRPAAPPPCRVDIDRVISSGLREKSS